ncbi:hypothetical protein KAX35_05765, partial [candidate division WOR-3 bacterium]|nr:hypothetical protein [candidate division WOR-3 bacterium]
MRKDLLNKVLFWGVVFVPLIAFTTDWYIMIVDSTPNSGVGGTSIALDSLGIPHIAYRDYDGNPPEGLIYASWNPIDSIWIREVIFDSAGVKSEIMRFRIAGCDPSLALDSKGYSHISFWWGDLGYAWKDSLGWHTTHPNPGPWIFGTSLDLDTNDYPHIGYFVYINDNTGWVLHTFLDESGWHNEILDTISDFSGHPVSVVVDRNNQIHIAYGYLHEEGTGTRAGIKYGVRDNSGNWNIERVVDTTDTSCVLEGMPTIQLDSMDYPHISYWSASGSHWIGRLKYVTKKDDIWHFEIIDIGEDSRMGGQNFLALDKFGNPHISYEGELWLKYAWKIENEWYIEKIDSIGVVANQASYTGLVIDEDGYAHISYNREFAINYSNLKYATGYPEMGIEIRTDEFDEELLMVCPSVGIAQGEVQIEYLVKKESDINLSIYNILGQKVTELVNERKQLGKYKDHWKTESVG